MVSKGEIHKEVIKRLGLIINRSPKIKIPKRLVFIVGDNSSLEESLESSDRIVHIEGHFTFSPDLGLLVTGDGVLDYERNKQRDNFDLKIGQYYFKEYKLVAEVQTNRADYLRALEKFEFPLRVRFKDRNSSISYDYDGGNGYTDMFDQIRSLRHVHVVEDFVCLNGEKILEEAEKTLRDKIAELGLGNYPAKYETICCDISGNEEDKFNYTSVAESEYTDPNTGVGFEVVFCPSGMYHPNPKLRSNYRWTVTLPEDLFEIIYYLNQDLLVCKETLDLRKRIGRVYNQLQAIYNKRFDTPNIDEWMDEDLVDFRGQHYSTITAGRINYILGNEQEFLRCFERWQNAINRLKYGKARELIEKPKELGPGIFENKE